MGDFFGLTHCGISNPIKDMVRKDYIENDFPENLLVASERGRLTRPFYALLSRLDCYTGRVDGFAYKSVSRLNRMRKKGVFKPVGPLDMYKYPCTTSMNMGWWYGDDVLKGEVWYLPRTTYPIPTSEKTKFVDQALRIDKLFRM